MGLIDRLLGRIRDLFAGGPRPEDDSAARDGSVGDAGPSSGDVAPVKCSICGTPVPDPDGACSLCGSTDLVSADRTPSPTSDAAPGETAASEQAVVDEAVDKAVAGMLGNGDLLSAYDDRWERVDGEPSRYRVAISDTQVSQVDSLDEVRTLLYRHYGPPPKE